MLTLSSNGFHPTWPSIIKKYGKNIMNRRTDKKSFGVTGSHGTEAGEKQCRDFHTNVNKWKMQEDEYSWKRLIKFSQLKRTEAPGGLTPRNGPRPSTLSPSGRWTGSPPPTGTRSKPDICVAGGRAGVSPGNNKKKAHTLSTQWHDSCGV